MACASSFGEHLQDSPQQAAMMGPEERWFSIAAGACLAGYGLSRLRIGSLTALAVGAYSVYRGASGRCLLRQKLAELQSQACGARAARGLNSPGHWDSSIEERALHTVDCIDEAAMESFPASDPPSYTGTTAAPSAPIQ